MTEQAGQMKHHQENIGCVAYKYVLNLLFKLMLRCLHLHDKLKAI